MLSAMPGQVVGGLEHNKVLDRYYQGLLDVKADKNDIDANKAGKGGSAFEKMPEHDKAALGDFNKQLELINGERVKSQASGMWQPDSPGAKAIAKQEASLLMQRDVLLKRYQGEAPAADPLSLRKPAAPAGGTKVSPMQQANNDSDRPTILAAEFKKAGTPEDRAGLQREIDRLPADQRTRTKALIDGTAPKAAAAAPKPSATPVTMQAVAQQIPEPPPKSRQIGLSTKPNPDYAEWEKKYGDAWRAERAAADEQSTKAAAVARTSFNPYMQNQVR